MSCPDRNQDLLLLTHGELGGIRRALLEQHLRRCSRCRERRVRYGALSGVIAGEIRPREMPTWTPHATKPPASTASTRRLALCVVLAILLGVAATAGVVWSPASWWSFGSHAQSHTIEEQICLPNAPGNAPNAPANKPAANK